MDAVERVCRPLKRASKMGNAFLNPRLKPGATVLASDQAGERSVAPGFSRGFSIAIPTSRARFSGRQRLCA
jgi:hypothetical protein